MVTGIVLAGGASRRMGTPKAELSLPNGDTFLRRVVRATLDAGVPQVVVVTGAVAGLRARAWPAGDRRVLEVHNTSWAQGQLTSLQAGVRHVTPEAEAVAVALVDVPLFSPETLRLLLARWRATRAPVVRPARAGEHGHPVIFDRRVFPDLLAADPALGAKPIVRKYGREVLDVDVNDPGAFRDYDTPADLAALPPA